MKELLTEVLTNKFILCRIQKYISQYFQINVTSIVKY